MKLLGNRPGPIFSGFRDRVTAGYKFFILPKKKWRLPDKSDLLFYDMEGSEAILPYLPSCRYDFIAVRGEFIIVPLLLCAVFKPAFWKGKLIEAYTDCFIQASSPKVVLTFIDNNTAFWSISKRFPSVKTIFVQNGWRAKSMDIFQRVVKSNKDHVDYMFVFNDPIGRYFKRYITGEALVTGSFKNNHIPVFDADAEPGVLFISQYDREPPDKKPVYRKADGTPVYFSLFQDVDAQVLCFLNIWCTTHHKVLRICGRSSDEDGLEREYFAKWLTTTKWTFSPLTDGFSTYKSLDSAEMVVVIDSTVGFEALARGKKTAFFYCRGAIMSDDAFRFGWPSELPDNGPFWTNIADANGFDRIMNYLNMVSDDEWEATLKHYSRELMAFDSGNRRFAALLEQLLCA